MKMLRARLLPLIDILLLPVVYPAAWLFRHMRRVGIRKLPHCRNAFLRMGSFPVRNHYYEPQFDHRRRTQPFTLDRSLPGVDLNVPEQLKMLASFCHTNELPGLSQEKINGLSFSFDNPLFGSGDAEYLYQIVRLMKPRRIFEIGSGNSTLVAIKAIQNNCREDPGYSCKHICIEPYERPWLEKTGLTIIRKRVEDLTVSFFSELEEQDILFIDSSHIINPQGDVLFEYLELLPVLNKGVIVHAHDIFTPRDYLKEILVERVRFWNEQYLLEAMLTQNPSWKIVGALNYLRHHHYEVLKSVAPSLGHGSEPNSFYIQKTA